MFFVFSVNKTILMKVSDVSGDSGKRLGIMNVTLSIEHARHHECGTFHRTIKMCSCNVCPRVARCSIYEFQHDGNFIRN
jgi:hypothetical protein